MGGKSNKDRHAPEDSDVNGEVQVGIAAVL